MQIPAFSFVSVYHT